MSTLPASFSYAFRGNYPTGRAAIFFQQLHKLPSTAALTMIVGPARFSRSMALELGCSFPRDEPRGAKEYEAACACRSPVTQKSRSQARPPLDASWQQSGALASEDYSSHSSQSDEKSNTKPGMCGAAQAPSNEGNRHECDCAPIVVRVMRCPSSLFDV